MQVELVTWQDIYDRCRVVARSIRKQGIKPDLVVAIARGGFAPARVLCDFLDIHDLASIKVEHYAAGAREKGEARVLFPVNAELKGRRVLLVDDVNDSGETLAMARPYLREQAPAELHTAVLDQKQRSPEPVDFQGRLVTEWHWITYPWAALEDLSAFIGNLPETPASLEQARAAGREAHGREPGDATLRDLAEYLGLSWK